LTYTDTKCISFERSGANSLETSFGDDTLRINIAIPAGSRNDVKRAISAWMSGEHLSPQQQGFRDLALQVNAAEQATLAVFASDQFEPLTIEVGA
jgi:hypothetical protein